MSSCLSPILVMLNSGWYFESLNPVTAIRSHSYIEKLSLLILTAAGYTSLHSDKASKNFVTMHVTFVSPGVACY